MDIFRTAIYLILPSEVRYMGHINFRYIHKTFPAPAFSPNCLESLAPPKNDDFFINEHLLIARIKHYTIVFWYHIPIFHALQKRKCWLNCETFHTVQICLSFQRFYQNMLFISAKWFYRSSARCAEAWRIDLDPEN